MYSLYGLRTHFPLLLRPTCFFSWSRPISFNRVNFCDWIIRQFLYIFMNISIGLVFILVNVGKRITTCFLCYLTIWIYKLLLWLFILVINIFQILISQRHCLIWTIRWSVKSLILIGFADVLDLWTGVKLETCSELLLLSLIKDSAGRILDNLFMLLGILLLLESLLVTLQKLLLSTV